MVLKMGFWLEKWDHYIVGFIYLFSINPKNPIFKEKNYKEGENFLTI